MHIIETVESECRLEGSISLIDIIEGIRDFFILHFLNISINKIPIEESIKHYVGRSNRGKNRIIILIEGAARNGFIFKGDLDKLINTLEDEVFEELFKQEYNMRPSTHTQSSVFSNSYMLERLSYLEMEGDAFEREENHLKQMRIQLRKFITKLELSNISKPEKSITKLIEHMEMFDLDMESLRELGANRSHIQRLISIEQNKEVADLKRELFNKDLYNEALFEKLHYMIENINNVQNLGIQFEQFSESNIFKQADNLLENLTYKLNEQNAVNKGLLNGSRRVNQKNELCLSSIVHSFDNSKVSLKSKRKGSCPYNLASQTKEQSPARSKDVIDIDDDNFSELFEHKMELMQNTGLLDSAITHEKNVTSQWKLDKLTKQVTSLQLKLINAEFDLRETKRREKKWYTKCTNLQKLLTGSLDDSANFGDSELDLLKANMKKIHLNNSKLTTDNDTLKKKNAELLAEVNSLNSNITLMKKIVEENDARRKKLEEELGYTQKNYNEVKNTYISKIISQQKYIENLNSTIGNMRLSPALKNDASQKEITQAIKSIENHDKAIISLKETHRKKDFLKRISSYFVDV